MSELSRIVVTGIGLVTPVGSDRESSWQGLLAGTSATRRLDGETIESLGPLGDDARAFIETQVGAPAVNDPEAGQQNSPVTRFAPLLTEPVITQALRAAREAVTDAALNFDDWDRSRVGCVIGTSKGGFRSLAHCFAPADDLDRRSEFFPQSLPNAAALAVQQEFGIRGASLAPVAACATGLLSIARGAQLIADGVCDIVLAGSSDASLSEIVLASYRRLGVLAHSFDDPKQACRPFDRRRNGFVIGEGAAVLVLERESTARERCVRPYGEWVAAGFGSDPTGLLQVETDPVTLTYVLKDVLRRAQVDPGQLSYVNLHGTGTRDNDRYETRALRNALGTAADRIPTSSLKGTIGHLLGAAGSVELAATFLALRDGQLPPTANLEELDPECDLDYVPQVARTQLIEAALKVSLGFGGHLTAAVIRAVAHGRSARSS